MVAPRTKAAPTVEPAPGIAEGADLATTSPAKRNRRSAGGNGSHAGAANDRTATPARHRGPPPPPSVETLTKRLLDSVRRHDDDADLAAIQRAVDFAVEAHGDQKRASGEPYVTHPIAAA